MLQTREKNWSSSMQKHWASYGTNRASCNGWWNTAQVPVLKRRARTMKQLKHCRYFFLCSWVRASWIIVITTPGTGRTVFANICWRGEVRVPTPPCQQTVANTVRPVPHVITVWMCSWWWMRVSSETRRAVCRKYNKTVYSRIFLDSYWHWHWHSLHVC